MAALFLLTRPMRDVTAIDGVNYNMATISTHTSHAGRDCTFPPLA